MKQEQAAIMETYHNPDGSVGCVKFTKGDGEVIIYGDEDVMHREIACKDSKCEFLYTREQ